MAVFARAAYAAGVDPVTLLFLRFAISAAVMLLLMRLRRSAFPRGGALLGLIAMGAVGYVGQSLCYFTALTLASAGLVALLLYLYPGLVAVLSALLLGERIGRVKAAALGLALVGAALTIGRGGGGQLLGIVLGLAAALIYSLYILAGSRLMRQAPPLAASAVVITSAGVVYSGIVALRGLHLPATPAGWAAILALALISTVVAIVTFLAGLERVGPTNASILSIVEPAVTVGLAALVLGEAITVGRVAGGALILVAVIVLARGELGLAPAVDHHHPRQHQSAAQQGKDSRYLA